MLEGGRVLEDGGSHLVEGQATYTVGDQRLTVGPGGGDTPVMMSAGEQYSWARGQLTLPGKRLYVTGRTPMNYDLDLSFSAP